MKRLAFALLVLTVITSCGRKAEKTAIPQNDHIKSYVKNVIDSAENYRYVNSNADSTRQISVIYSNGYPVMVASSSSVMLHDELYVLSGKDARVVYLHEIISDPVSYRQIENQLYYDNDTLVLAQTLGESGWVPYVSDDSLGDYRFSCALLNDKVRAMIMEAERDRLTLSPAGNAARRQGALYWAEGDTPYWTVMVTPNEKVVVALDNGERYEYPVFASDKLDELATRYYGVGDDGHNFELILNDIPQPSNDSVQPKVSATLTHKGKVYEGLAVNLMDF